VPSTGDGRLPLSRRGADRDPVPTGMRRREASAPSLLEPGQRRTEILSSAAVILAGVLVVIGFGFVASRAMRADNDPPNLSEPAAPGLGEVTLPSPDQSTIPLGTPTPSATPKSPTGAPTSKKPPPPDPGTLAIASGNVPTLVNLPAEGSWDWVHWGEAGTFSLERDKDGGFGILEGAPTAPRFRHALSPQRFEWTGGDPVDHSDGTPTGIRTCGKGNAFTISAPATTGTRVLKLYVGVLAAKGRLSAKLTTGTATAVATLEEPDAVMRTAVLTLTYRAPKTGNLRLTWSTQEAFGTGCGGVALEAAALS
jgi:hypothetical protein